MKSPVLRWFGGKYRIAPWIVSHFPPHKIYVEPYGGAASVLMRKPASYAEVWNDLNDEVFALFWVLRSEDMHMRLKKSLEHTPFSRREFELAHTYTPDPIERSRRLIVRSLMGFGADSACDPTNKTGFRSNTTRSGSTPAHVFVNYSEHISAFHQRLRGVVIENKDALEIMDSHDTPETLHYLDPPYIQSLRRVGAYSHEMTDEAHAIMLDKALALKGKVIISGYSHEMYSEKLRGWQKAEKSTRSDKAGARTEILWMNFERLELSTCSTNA